MEKYGSIRPTTADSIFATHSSIAKNGYSDIFIVYYKRHIDAPRILENDTITVWGTSIGVFPYEVLDGREITSPAIEAIVLEIK